MWIETTRRLGFDPVKDYRMILKMENEEGWRKAVDTSTLVVFEKVERMVWEKEESK